MMPTRSTLYYYGGGPNELLPQEVIQYFIGSSRDGWCEEEGVFGSLDHLLIRLEPRDGKFVLLYMDTPVAIVSMSGSSMEDREILDVHHVCLMVPDGSWWFPPG